MASIDQVWCEGPVIIDPARCWLDRIGVIVGMDGAPALVLEGEKAKRFYDWVREYWRERFERDLQGLSTHPSYGPLLTTWLPLVTFREDLCARAEPRKDEALTELLDELRAAMRNWRAAGADTVFISGVDARDRVPEGI